MKGVQPVSQTLRGIGGQWPMRVRGRWEKGAKKVSGKAGGGREQGEGKVPWISRYMFGRGERPQGNAIFRRGPAKGVKTN